MYSEARRAYLMSTSKHEHVLFKLIAAETLQMLLNQREQTVQVPKAGEVPRAYFADHCFVFLVLLYYLVFHLVISLINFKHFSASLLLLLHKLGPNLLSNRELLLYFLFKLSVSI